MARFIKLRLTRESHYSEAREIHVRADAVEEEDLRRACEALLKSEVGT